LFNPPSDDETGKVSYTLIMTMNICKGFFSIAAFLTVVLSPLSAQNDGGNGGTAHGIPQAEKPGSQAVRLTLGNTGPYTLTELSDWSRYDNGSYKGHVYREVRASIIPQEAGSSSEYRGNFFVLEETLRNTRQSARGVNAVIPVHFRTGRDGSLTIVDDRGFPSLRGFPAYPAEAVRPGAKWTARGNRAVDPLNQGRPVVVPLVAEYEYRGIELYNEVPVHRVGARYASRYQAASFGGGQAGGTDAPDQAGFQVLEGSHTVDILLRVSDGLPILIRDRMDETFTWADGSTTRFRGFTLTFGQGMVPLDRENSITLLEDTLNIAPSSERRGTVRGGNPENGGGRSQPNGKNPPGITNTGENREAKPPLPALTEDRSMDITSVPEGIRLTVRDLRFAPDSAELLPGEQTRLDAIAQALKDFPDRTFLVEGHTAAIGRPQGEMRLSLERAQRIVAELSGRGIPADRFIYKGSGGTNPVGDNSNEEGRRLNRRVEITILE
jgi:outer membrane protein OmpA-like peptidoglycan-associated protein